MEELSDAQVLVLAAQLAATPDLPTFRLLAATQRDVLTSAIVYRTLLTYLPLDADLEVEQQLELLLRDLDQDFANFNTLDAPANVHDLQVPNPSDAERSLPELRLEKVPVHDENEGQDLLADFVIAWIHKLEGFSGISASVLALVDQFAVQHTMLRIWADAFLRPLHRLQNDLYPDQASSLSLHDLEAQRGQTGVNALLTFAAHSGTSAAIGRDLEEVVAPWVRGSNKLKRRKVSAGVPEQTRTSATAWDDVNEWLLGTSHRNYALAADAVQQWNGPTQLNAAEEDVDQNGPDVEDMVSYVRTVLALVYVSKGSDDDSRINTKKLLLKRAAHLAQLMPPDFNQPLPETSQAGNLTGATRADLLEDAFLSVQNSLTRPSTDVIELLYGVLSTQTQLSELKIQSTTKSVTSTVLFEPEEKQKQELRTILNQVPRMTRSNLSWTDIRRRLLWLQTWSSRRSGSDVTGTAYLSRISDEYLEAQIVDAMLVANEYQSVKDTYLGSDELALPREKIKQLVLDAIHSAYDNASNGNRTRGGVKKASDLIQAFRSSFESASEFTRLEHLIKATHSLSFYHLTLRNGVPFQPVSIRVSSDPLSLIEKVLDQNNQAYAKLDDLLGIARNLVLAGLPTPPPSDYAPGEEVPVERRLFDSEHRITYSAIIAALSDHDFDTAYSLITTRFDITSDRSSYPSFQDDTSWRAAYAAGRHRPSSPPKDIHKRIASLQKRMELLSKALTWAPTPDTLPEILETWRRCEDELDGLKSQALQEERDFDAQGDDLVPGGFGPSDRDIDANETRRMLDSRRGYNTFAPSYEEEAPVSLFDVARGAAGALRKNAFPLRGAGGGQGGWGGQTSGIKVHDQPRTSMEGMSSSGELERPGSADGQRVRKRDMLSNAVTGGLVSGLSWALGAPPARQQG
ncbi:hypothetical protein PMZ80_007786 [Knufia obscura]|uniref:Sec39 domain-containing protein n=2 Tax=Knufia TaxID=430999 RepID=A0AAN8I8A7_9EURO|nr:hypothetical protein PMZ80_007786 [Knufia obscura]KAK5954321.1 hypothetical protein OHC33_004894 [Knufia fluminis]